jgi:hypothetical protein
MDIAVLNDARGDLAIRMAMLDIPELNRQEGNNAQGWIAELIELEERRSYSVVIGALEYYIEKASRPQSVLGLGIAIDFYLDSLWEWKMFGKAS